MGSWLLRRKLPPQYLILRVRISRGQFPCRLRTALRAHPFSTPRMAAHLQCLPPDTRDPSTSPPAKPSRPSQALPDICPAPLCPRLIISKPSQGARRLISEADSVQHKVP